MTATFLFFFMEEVFMQGIGCPALGDTSLLEEPSRMYIFPQSSFCWFSDSKASYRFYKGREFYIYFIPGKVSHGGNHPPTPSRNPFPLHRHLCCLGRHYRRASSDLLLKAGLAMRLTKLLRVVSGLL